MSTPWPTPPRIPDYDLLKPIGRGSYGEVWLARSVTGVFRIIKVVRRDRFEDDRPYRRELEGISRFQAAVSGRPRQLALLHVGRNDEAGYFYYVMEPADDVETGSAIDPDRYIPLTLKELFSRRGRLPAAECVQLTLELARGLAVLHAENLIHRDIKPSNIIFVQRVPKLADVGLVASSETAMTCVGTPGYSPPEGPGSPSADLYGLGKVLYEISTGLDRLDFPRLPADIADTSDAPLLREINALVLRSCDRDPRKRPASAEIFARNLELIQAGQSVAFYEAVRRRLRLFAIAAGAVALVAAFGAGLFFWRAGVQSRANAETRRALYRSDLAVVQLALTGGDLGRARAALDRQVPRPGETDLRGIEWNIFAHSARGEGTPLEPATNGVAVRSLVADPTGRWLAAAFEDNSAAIWDLRTRRVVRRLAKVHTLGGFNSDGLLVVDEPERALRYESPTGGVQRRIETGRRLFSLLDNSQCWTIEPSVGCVFCLQNLPNLKTIFTVDLENAWPKHRVSKVDITPNRERAVLGLYREDGAQRQRVLAVTKLPSSTVEWSSDLPGRLLWIRCSPNNTHFAVNQGGPTPNLVCLTNPASSIPLVGHTARVEDGAYSPDGSLIATASADQTIRIWRTSDGKNEAVLRGLDRPATAIKWLSDGVQVAAGDNFGTVRLFRHPADSRSDLFQGFYADVHGDFTFDSDGSQIAISSTTNSIHLINLGTPSHSAFITNVFQPVRFEGNDQVLVAFASDWSLRAVHVGSSKTLTTNYPVENVFPVKAFATSASRSLVALGGPDGKVSVIDVAGRSGFNLVDPDRTNIWALAFSESSDELWVGSALGSIRTYSTKTGHQIGPNIEAFGDINALALSPDGRWLAASLYTDSSVRIYNRLSHQWLRPIFSHRRASQSMFFTLDNSRLVSGGLDGKLIIWRVDDFEELASLDVAQDRNATGDEGISMIHLSPTGEALAAFTEEGSLRTWKITGPVGARPF